MTLSAHQWTLLIDSLRPQLDPIIIVQDIEKVLKGGNHGTPLQVLGTNQRRYALKLMRVNLPLHGYSLATEQVVGRLGKYINAPIVQPVRLSVSQTLISAFAQSGDRLPGNGHASELLEGRTLREERGHPLTPVTKKNREDHALLGFLYGFVGASDQQVLRDANTQEIFSHDHGIFLPGGPNWNRTTLANLPVLGCDPWFQDPDPIKVDEARNKMKSVTDSKIAEIAAYVDPSWGVTADDLAALAEYLAARRDML